MKRLKTFRIGGIHPHDNKLTAGKEVITVTPPATVIIPISQHIGAPATPVVKKGDMVKVGTLIAKSSGFVSANIHSSVSGKVVKIDNIVDASGYAKPAIQIKVEGDEWEDSIDRSNEIIRDTQLEPKEIVNKIAEMGIVGLGGATFPTHIKLSPPPGQKATSLIINAVECEPYLTSDDAIMRAHANEIMIGCHILMKALGISTTFIGIENNKPEATKIMTQASATDPSITIVPLKMQYPQGGEKQLIDAVIRKQVASGALPISQGAVVQNVGTVFAVYEAVMKNKPLFERIITVTGKSVKNGGNFLARIGTPMSYLIEQAGGIPDDLGKVIGGGPMMGRALSHLDVPMTKGSSGLLLMSQEEAQRKIMEDCIRCGKCVNVCPMGLNPAFLMRDTVFQRWDNAEKTNVFDCIECGSCSYTCPANRPLLDYIRMGKQTVMGIMRSRK